MVVTWYTVINDTTPDIANFRGKRKAVWGKKKKKEQSIQNLTGDDSWRHDQAERRAETVHLPSSGV